jgi:hypothetical protein
VQNAEWSGGAAGVAARRLAGVDFRMDIVFATDKMRKVLTDERAMVRAYGPEQARVMNGWRPCGRRNHWRS